MPSTAFGSNTVGFDQVALERAMASPFQPRAMQKLALAQDTSSMDPLSPGITSPIEFSDTQRPLAGSGRLERLSAVGDVACGWVVAGLLSALELHAVAEKATTAKAIATNKDLLDAGESLETGVIFRLIFTSEAIGLKALLPECAPRICV